MQARIVSLLPRVFVALTTPFVIPIVVVVAAVHKDCVSCKRLVDAFSGKQDWGGLGSGDLGPETGCRGRAVHSTALHYFAHFLLMTISMAILHHCLALDCLLSQLGCHFI